jgi:hypothetical protein
LRLQVVAGAGLLLFGHGCLARRRLAGLVCGWLSAEAGCLCARWRRFGGKKRAALDAVVYEHCVKQC